MNRILLSFSLCFFAAILLAQPTRNLVGYYSLNSAELRDESNNNPNAILNGNPSIECGATNNSIYFDGVDDDIEFDGDYFGHLDGDFTISFYMLPDETGGQQELFSFMDTCSTDSLFSMVYSAASNSVTANLLGTNGNNAVLVGLLDQNTCWQHIILTRDDGSLELFVNGESQMQFNTQLIPFQLNGKFRFSNSPCIENGPLIRYQGKIDEIRIYNRLVEVSEFRSLEFQVDEILTPDTTMLEGSTAQIRTSNSCASSFSWSPIAGVSSPSNPNSSISPLQTESYVLSFIYPTCTARDTVTLTLVDPDLVDCKEVLVPNAFTPNGDGLNDVFGVSNPFVIEEFVSFQILDRWGAVVFQANNLNDFWDGIVDGEEANPGVFVYELRWKCEGTEERKFSSFSLIR